MDHVQGRHRAGDPPRQPRPLLPGAGGEVFGVPPADPVTTPLDAGRMPLDAGRSAGAAALRSERWQRLLSQDRAAPPPVPAPVQPRSRWSLRWRVGFAAVVTLLAGAAGVLAVLWFQSAGRSVEIHRVDASAARSISSSAPEEAGRKAENLPGGAAAGPTRAPGSTGGSVVVHVAGAVAKPGVFTLAAGSRVVQALQAAGGPRPDAVTAALNLAAVLSDGEQVLVPAKGQQLPAATAAGTGVGKGSAAAGAAAPARKVNLNTAGVEELTTLPKVGPVLAQRIVDWRTQHGAFGSPQELDAVEGVGPKLLEALLPLVTV